MPPVIMSHSEYGGWGSVNKKDMAAKHYTALRYLIARNIMLTGIGCRY